MLVTAEGHLALAVKFQVPGIVTGNPVHAGSVQLRNERICSLLTSTQNSAAGLTLSTALLFGGLVNFVFSHAVL